MQENVNVFEAPPRARMLLEGPRTALDFIGMVRAQWSGGVAQCEGRGRRVMVVPGFGATDAYTRWLRKNLNQLGFKAEGWGLGPNLGGKGLTGEVDFFETPSDLLGRPELEVPLMVMKLRERVRQRALETGEPYILIGHSLGGYMAREVARQLPEHIVHLVTLGAPIYGGPKYTAAGALFKKRGVDVDRIEALIAEREPLQIKAAITTVVSSSDAVVGFEASVDRHQPHAALHVLNVSHCGMAFNPTVWRIVQTALA